jgi:hypothetical protein
MSYKTKELSALKGIGPIQLKIIKRVKYALALDFCVSPIQNFLVGEETEKLRRTKLKKYEIRYKVKRMISNNKSKVVRSENKKEEKNKSPLKKLGEKSLIKHNIIRRLSRGRNNM